MAGFTREGTRVYLGEDPARPEAEITFHREEGGRIVIDEEAQMTERKVARILPGVETRDGAGVRLRRMFSNRDVQALDPFLLFDVFGSQEAEDYIAGFPMHPHRGIETVTFMLEGRVMHRDSLGNAGTIGPGDLQWMSAGSGIIHEEMPQESPRGVRGLQLWVNLPKAEKMRDPAYRDAAEADIPSVAVPGGQVRPIAGSYNGITGPLKGIARDPAYFDARLEAGASVAFPGPATQTMFAYVYEGSLGMAAEAEGKAYPAGTCLLFGPGDQASLKAGPEGARFVVARAEPLREPIAWGGPIVMNTQEELRQAFDELDRGTFIKPGRRGGR